MVSNPKKEVLLNHSDLQGYFLLCASINVQNNVRKELEGS